MTTENPRECFDCKAVAPDTETAHTLISPRFGWRLSRGRDEAGEFVPEWRCPKCWREHKRSKGLAASGEFAAALAAPSPPPSKSGRDR